MQCELADVSCERDLEAAATAFGLASRAFVYPEEEFAASVRSGDCELAWKYVCERLGIAEPALCRPEAVPRKAGEPSRGAEDGAEEDGTLRALRIEYTNTFLNLPHAAVSPYESVWKGEKGQKTLVFVNDIALSAKEAYRKAGFSPSGMTEPADHVAYELDFIGRMLSTGNAEDAAEFWHGHLEDWIGPFCKAVREVRKSGFYASLAAFLPSTLASAMKGVERACRPQR